MGSNTVDVVLSVNGADASPQALDRMTTVLSDDLRAARIGRVDRGSATAEPGSKSGLVPLVGELTVSGMAAAGGWMLYRTLIAFLDRGKARSITVKLGTTEIEVTAASKDEIATVLELAIKQALDVESPEPRAEKRDE